MTKPAPCDHDFESPKPGVPWAVRHKLAFFITTLIVLVVVQVIINHALSSRRRAAVAIQPANPIEVSVIAATSDPHAPIADTARPAATENPVPLAAIDPNAPLLIWDPATGTWKAQRLGDPQPAPHVAQGVTYTDGYYDMQLGRFVPGAPPSATVVATPSPDDQTQRRVALQQRIAALEAEIENDVRRVNGLGILGQGFGKAPDVVRAKPPEDRGHAFAGAVAEVLSSSLANQAGQEQAEAQARLDANRRTLQELRNELAVLGR
jgi:hypothetical protein